jgi:hypothetical protein
MVMSCQRYGVPHVKALISRESVSELRNDFADQMRAAP